MKQRKMLFLPLVLLFAGTLFVVGACEKETEETATVAARESGTGPIRPKGGGDGGTIPDPCAIRLNFYETIELNQSSPFSMYDFNRIKAVSTFTGFPSGVKAHVYINTPMGPSYSDWYDLTGVAPGTTKYFSITPRNKPIRLAVWVNECLYFDVPYN